MSCFNQGCGTADFTQKCCTPASMCKFDGNLNCVSTEPVFVQKVFDAVLFNLQGLKSVTNQQFTPALPQGSRIKRIAAIRCKKYFDPSNINNPQNLKVSAEVTISGGMFLEDGNCEQINVIGPDGTPSQKLIYADTSECGEKDCGTPIFGTQNMKISGNVVVELDVVVCDDGNRDCPYTLTANVPIATPSNPMLLTNFFELCLPNIADSAFLPRFTEFCNIVCDTRLATNNLGRDLVINPETGCVCANLIIALCLTCEKKIVIPVQLCVLSTGYTVLAPETGSICNTYPQLFPNTPSGENCDCIESETANKECCCECECEIICKPKCDCDCKC